MLEQSLGLFQTKKVARVLQVFPFSPYFFSKTRMGFLYQSGHQSDQIWLSQCLGTDVIEPFKLVVSRIKCSLHNRVLRVYFAILSLSGKSYSSLSPMDGSYTWMLNASRWSNPAESRHSPFITNPYKGAFAGYDPRRSTNFDSKTHHNKHELLCK